MTVKVTSKMVQGLTDGFTGGPLDVFMTVAAGSPPLYSCPEAFSVHVPYASLAELQDAVSMENGVRGLRDRVRPTDPYTGEALRLRMFPDGRVAYCGGLNPRRAFVSLEELCYRLSMRNGKTPFPKPGAPAEVERPAREARELPEENVPSDATRDAVEKIVAEHMPRGTQVSMAGGPKRKKNGAAGR